MGCYLILSDPLGKTAPLNYKGLYRSEPFPDENFNREYMSLWSRYVEYCEPLRHMGITTELTLDELFKLSKLSTEFTGCDFEVVFVSRSKTCPHDAIFYGIDVAETGGYSILGEGLFREPYDKFLSKILRVINSYFKNLLNDYGLFNTLKNAQLFLDTLKDLNEIAPNCVEFNNWQAVYVYGLK